MKRRLMSFVWLSMRHPYTGVFRDGFQLKEETLFALQVEE